MKYMWNGRDPRIAMSDQEFDRLKSLGFIEVAGFELDRHLPSEAEVKQQLLDDKKDDAAEYETKEMKPKKKKLFKGSEGDK